MNFFSCFSRYKSKHQKKLIYNQLIDDDSLQILNLMITDNNLNVQCRQKLAEAVIEQGIHS